MIIKYLTLARVFIQGMKLILNLWDRVKEMKSRKEKRGKPQIFRWWEILKMVQFILHLVDFLR